MAYIMFFVAVWIFGNGLLLMCLLTISGFVIMWFVNFPIGMVLSCFFAGGVGFQFRDTNSISTWF
jgi:hypothetical protein